MADLTALEQSYLRRMGEYPSPRWPIERLEALRVCSSLAAKGFCRVVKDGKQWRVFQSKEQTRKALTALGVKP